jgi:predicted permease
MFGTFIVSQVAVSLMLLVAAGLLLRTLREASSFDPGFNSEQILLAKMNLAPYGYDEVSGREFYRELRARLSTTPGVVSVSFAQVIPLGGDADRQGFRVPGHEPSPEDPTIPIDLNIVGPGYFSVMGIPILRGRDFDERDTREGAQPVLVINETMARRFWPGEDPIGQLIQIGADGPFTEIIGVARDIKYYSLGEEPRPYVYQSFAQSYSGFSALHIRSAGDPSALVGAVRRQIAALDPVVPVRAITTFAELRRAPLLPQRALAAVTTIFGAVALVLTAVGLYGLVSYSVTQRTREIGLRMALGARPSGITGMVIKQGMVLTAIGVGAGLAGSLATTRFLAGFLFGVAPTDPITFAAISSVMAGIALLACYLPASRAMKIDPMVALRFD